MRKDLIILLAIAAIFAKTTNLYAQIALTKTLPPIGTTYELWGNASLPNTTAIPDTGANITWDYSAITTTYNNDIIIRGLSEVPSSEQTLVPNAVYVEEQILPGAPNTDWLPRVFYQDNGDFLIEIAKKNFGTTTPVLSSDTVFEFNLPYQSSTLVNLGATGGGGGNFEYAGYGTLIIGSDTYNNVAMFTKVFTIGSVNGSIFYFYTLTPHYHRLARIFFYDGNVVAPGINYYKPAVTPTATADFENIFSSLTVYPNPASEMVTIGNLPIGSTLTITNITGKVVYNSLIDNEQTTINTSNYVNGVYILQVSNNGIVATKKLVIN